MATPRSPATASSGSSPCPSSRCSWAPPSTPSTSTATSPRGCSPTPPRRTSAGSRRSRAPATRWCFGGRCRCRRLCSSCSSAWARGVQGVPEGGALGAQECAQAKGATDTCFQRQAGDAEVGPSIELYTLDSLRWLRTGRLYCPACPYWISRTTSRAAITVMHSWRTLRRKSQPCTLFKQRRCYSVNSRRLRG